MVVDDFYVWQVVSYMFLHDGPWHLIFNMLVLWLIGSALEREWGGKQFLRYYLVCGLGGALFFMIFDYKTTIPVVGASGGVFGVLLAYAMLFPNNPIYLYFLLPVKAKHLVAGLVVVQLALGISGPKNVAYCAHLGGMAAGLLFFRSVIAHQISASRTRRRWDWFLSERHEKKGKQETANIDSILDKISAKGYDNLTTTEKRILENYSRKRKEDSE
jgi:membrane associated rhomboid family serine protease